MRQMSGGTPAARRIRRFKSLIARGKLRDMRRRLVTIETIGAAGARGRRAVVLCCDCRARLCCHSREGGNPRARDATTSEAVPKAVIPAKAGIHLSDVSCLTKALMSRKDKFPPRGNDSPQSGNDRGERGTTAWQYTAAFGAQRSEALNFRLLSTHPRPP